ncbi:MAG: hypothetical protein KBD35_05325 [Moraxellaceae bacterium]|jgi:hypothetical protein|nr:hypothetical protein [Moraxellaceae bacterium]MBP8852460.1 hypothetical protein [Moraxellaceae bacterium]MBP9045867.1 hypothetical protein [Moraxellaceae bacterium]MBP9730808.1 hypothetical protein [Moraxellaceae bacterium]
MTFAYQTASISELKKQFSALPAPAASVRHGFFRASFVGPAWLRLSARPSLEISGLPGWQGKKFLSVDDATNVLKKRGTLVEALAMRVTPGVSQVDGRQGLALHYVAKNGKPAPLPWRFVRDELRAVDADTLLCMTVIDLPVLRHLAFPFLLQREA